MYKNKLFSISPLDGRYNSETEELQQYFSEYALIYYRVFVEISWIKFLASDVISKEIIISQESLLYLDSIIKNFSLNDALEVKNWEKTTQHDVKAVEYYLKQKFDKYKDLKKIKEFIHFGCTSEDINNISYALMIKISFSKNIKLHIKNLQEKIHSFSQIYSSYSMLSRTHGQAASPTVMGKEFLNFSYRLYKQIKNLQNIKHMAKFNGAVGNFNAHCIAYPELNWHEISKNFIKSLNLNHNPITTQIEPHDYISEYLDCITRINNILIDFCRDIWGYISIGYFKQKFNENEIGSSTMPHKVNPIDFEKAEGNLGLANSIMTYLSSKLLISRWQRDLTDSTTFRNIGTALSHSVISYKAINKGLDKLEINNKTLLKDLSENYNILGEALQTIMRRYNIKNAYEKIKNLTKGKNLCYQNLIDFLDTLNIPEEVKQRCKNLTPQTYIGMAQKLCDLYKDENNFLK